MNDKLAIYQLNVQSADKLDERRDLCTRAYGVVSVAVTAASAGTIDTLPFLSAVLWALLCGVAIAWLATLNSLTAKLTAKNRLLTEMEERCDVPVAFLTQERRSWEDLRALPLAKALRSVPWAFLLLGVLGLVGTLGHWAWSSLCLCP